MQVITELYFINNFIICMYTLYLGIQILRLNYSLIRVVLSSLICAVIMYVFTIIKSNSIYFIITSIVISCIFSAKYKDIYTYFYMIVINLALRISIVGLFLIVSLLLPSSQIYVSNITFQSSVLIVVFLVSILISMFSKKINKEKLQNKNYFLVEISNMDKKIRTLALLDTGNNIFSKSGQAVNIVSNKVFKCLDLIPVENVEIQTINGKSSLIVANATIKIYFDNGMNKIVNIMVGKSDNLMGAKIILNNNILEVI